MTALAQHENSVNNSANGLSHMASGGGRLDYEHYCVSGGLAKP